MITDIFINSRLINEWSLWQNEYLVLLQRRRWETLRDVCRRRRRNNPTRLCDIIVRSVRTRSVRVGLRRAADLLTDKQQDQIWDQLWIPENKELNQILSTSQVWDLQLPRSQQSTESECEECFYPLLVLHHTSTTITPSGQTESF